MKGNRTTSPVKEDPSASPATQGSSVSPTKAHRTRIIAAIVAALSLVAIVCSVAMLSQTKPAANMLGSPDSANIKSSAVASESQGAGKEVASNPVDATGIPDTATAEDTDGLLDSPSGIQSKQSAQDGRTRHSEKHGSHHDAESEDDAAASQIHVSVAIEATVVQDDGWPASMGSASLTLLVGSTVYDALRATGASLTGSASYVSSINGLYAGMYGASSGWMYSVNGIAPMKAANAHPLVNDDLITWYYTL